MDSRCIPRRVVIRQRMNISFGNERVLSNAFLFCYMGRFYAVQWAIENHLENKIDQL